MRRRCQLQALRQVSSPRNTCCAWRQAEGAGCKGWRQIGAQVQLGICTLAAVPTEHVQEWKAGSPMYEYER